MPSSPGPSSGRSGLRINLSPTQQDAPPLTVETRVCAATRLLCARDCPTPGPCKAWSFG